jgi:hypothetical protein
VPSEKDILLFVIMEVERSVNDCFEACEAETSVASLQILFRALITHSEKVDYAYSLRFGSLLTLAFMSAGVSTHEKELTLDILVLWLEQQDDPNKMFVPSNLPILTVLERLCELASSFLPPTSAVLHKIWFLYIFNSVDMCGTAKAYERKLTAVNRSSPYEAMKALFLSGPPAPQTGSNIDDHYNEDPVRDVRYDCIFSFLAFVQGEVEVSREVAERALRQSFEASMEVIARRPQSLDDLVCSRIFIRSQLALCHLQTDNYAEAIAQLVSSASEQCLQPDVMGDEDSGYRQFLLTVSIRGSTFGASELLAYEGGGHFIPHEGAKDFSLLICARARLLRSLQRRQEGRNLLEVARLHISSRCPAMHGDARIDGGFALNYNVALKLLQESLLSFNSDILEE